MKACGLQPGTELGSKNLNLGDKLSRWFKPPLPVIGGGAESKTAPLHPKVHAVGYAVTHALGRDTPRWRPSRRRNLGTNSVMPRGRAATSSSDHGLDANTANTLLL